MNVKSGSLNSIFMFKKLLMGLVFLSITFAFSTFTYAQNSEISEFLQGNQAEQAQIQNEQSQNPTTATNDNNQIEIVEQPDTIIEYIDQKISDSSDHSDESNHEFQSINDSGQLLANSEVQGDYNDAYIKLNAINTGLPALSTPPNLQTPLATLEFFHTANLNNNYILAAHALNLNAVPESEQINKATELSKKLDYLLTEKGLYLFDDMPDRADGLIEPAVGSQNPLKGVPRRAIKLGYIDFGSRKIPLYIERVQVGDNPPIWVFSSQTVLNIESLYDMHKPAEFERYFPDWLKAKFFGVTVWEYLILLVFMLLTLGIGWLFSKGVEKAVDWYSAHRTDEDKDKLSIHDRGFTDLVKKITVPLTITISFSLVFTLISGGIPKVDAIASATRPYIWVCLVFSTLWLGIRMINFFANRYQDLQIENLDEERFHKERKRRTYLSIFRRVFIFVLILGSTWISLAEFADLEGLGKTLLTSAGIAGAVIGIAAQPTLGNIIAGLQVAVTQPIRIGDTIMLDGIWCEVEDLRYTYTVLKTWDDRRLIVPMKYFVTEVLENWSHTDTNQSSAIYLYVDYDSDIAKIRQKFIELVEEHELWNEQFEPQLLVTNTTEESVKLRGKISSDSPQNAWQMECDIREKLLDFIQQEKSVKLPAERLTLTSRDV